MLDRSLCDVSQGSRKVDEKFAQPIWMDAHAGLSANNGRRRCGRLKTKREQKGGCQLRWDQRLQLRCSSTDVDANPRVRFRNRALNDSKFSNWFEEPNFRFIDHLCPLFPHMDDQILEKALQEIGNDLDATSVDDAKTRAARLVEVLEKSISAHATSRATTALQRVYLVLQLLALTVLVLRIWSWEFGRLLL